MSDWKCDLHTLNRVQRAVERSIKTNEAFEQEHGIRLCDSVKEAQANLLAIIAIKRAQAMAA